MKMYLLAFMITIVAVHAQALNSALSKARALTLPTLQYRDASLGSILDDIQKNSREVDPETWGVHFVVIMGDAALNKKITITLNSATIEHSLNVLAAPASLDIKYDPEVIIINSSEPITDESE